MPRSVSQSPHGWGVSPSRATPWMFAVLKAVLVVSVLGLGLHMLYH